MALMLAVLLGIVAQSLVAAISETHAVAGQPAQDGHGHAAHHLSHDEEVPAGLGKHADAEGSMHVLLHHSPCFHGAWMAGSCSAQLAFAPLLVLMAAEPAGRIPAFTPSTPFRPPIAA